MRNQAITMSGIHVYPVKGCAGIALMQADVGRTGFQYDRHWMFVDDRGMFVAQRTGRGLGTTVSSVCLVRTAIAGGTLTLTAPSMPPLCLPLAGSPGVELPVTVWDDTFAAIDQGDDAESWATAFLSRERPGRYRLVRMPDHHHRASRMGGGEVAFGDAYSFLVISEASLADLNTRLPEPLPMNRFRPNIVLSGAGPYLEDHVNQLRIGAVEFTGTTLCLRCPTTTTDQETAVRGKEPLRTLATYRKQPDGVVFGRNFVHSGAGTICVGDPVNVVMAAASNS